MLHVLRVEMVINSPWMLSKNWLVQKQTALGKDMSNPFMADNLPKIFWNTAVVKRSGNVTRLQALVDKKRIVITEEVVREILQLNDTEGTNIADLSKHTTRYISPVLTQKVFANLRRVGKGFSGVKTPLFKSMLAVRDYTTRKRKGVVIRDPEKELQSDTPAETPKVKEKGKGILIEAPKPMKKKDQIEMDADINEKLAQKAAKRRKLSEEAQEADDLRKRLEIVQDEDDDVFVEATPLAQKVPVVDYHIIVINNKPKYKIIRADDTHQFYISFTTLLKNFNREDFETL
nr:hypothetical protein [Tanacetum cinerariifolium]